MRNHSICNICTGIRRQTGVPGLLELGLAVVIFPNIAPSDPAPRVQSPPLATPTESGKRPRIIPWIEINDPAMPLSKVDPNVSKDRAGLSLLEHALEGLTLWSQVTDVAIVTTRPGQVRKLYPVLMERKPPGIRIIGGLKTSLLPGCAPGDPRPYDFSDSDGWRALAAEAEDIMRLTGNREILLENETALKPFHSGKAKIDFHKLSRSLAVWRDTGVEVWLWLPFILGDNAEMPSRTTATRTLVATFAESVPDSVFLMPYAGWHQWQRFDAEVQRRTQMSELLGLRRARDLLYVTVDGYMHSSPSNKKRCYKTPEAVQQVNELGREVIIYPGAAEWVNVAREHVQLLSPSKPPSP